MRPMEEQRYLVFVAAQEERGEELRWLLASDTFAADGHAAIKETVERNAPCGEHEYRAVAWDDVEARVVRVWREVEIR